MLLSSVHVTCGINCHLQTELMKMDVSHPEVTKSECVMNSEQQNKRYERLPSTIIEGCSSAKSNFRTILPFLPSTKRWRKDKRHVERKEFNQRRIFIFEFSKRLFMRNSVKTRALSTAVLSVPFSPSYFIHLSLKPPSIPLVLFFSPPAS